MQPAMWVQHARRQALGTLRPFRRLPAFDVWALLTHHHHPQLSEVAARLHGTRPAHAQTRCLHNEPGHAPHLDAPSGDRRQGATRRGGGGCGQEHEGCGTNARSTAPRWALRPHASRLEVRCAGRERRLANRALGGAARQPIATQAEPPAAHDVPSRVLSLRYLQLYLIQSFAARLQLVRQL
jgi:hypothetical protein